MKAQTKLAGGVLLVLLISMISFFDIYLVRSISMEPILSDGDRAITLEASVSKIHRGDIVVVKIREETSFLIKRVIGMQGDTIHVFDKYLKIGKNLLPHDPVYYLITNNSSGSDMGYKEYLLETNNDNLKDLSYRSLEITGNVYFLAGDNYYQSMDSRFFGLIEDSLILGKVIFSF